MKGLFGLLTVFIFLQPMASFGVEISSVEVRLFYNDSGVFSKNILNDNDFQLWNTVIGEGSAAEPSDRFMIRAKFTGPANEYVDQDIKLSVKNSETGKTIYSETFYGFMFNSLGINFRAALISEHDCQPLLIQVGDKKESINFRCGE